MRDVRWLICARLTSGVGDFALPVILVSLLTRGAWARRVSPQRVMIVASLGAAAVQAAVVGLYVARRPGTRRVDARARSIVGEQPEAFGEIWVSLAPPQEPTPAPA